MIFEKSEVFNSYVMVQNPHDVVGKDFPGSINVREGYSDFFDGLLSVVLDGDGKPVVPVEETGSSLRTYVMKWLESHPLDGFNDYSDDSYIRTYIGKDFRTGWEAIVMTWKQGNTTTIHGHPGFAAYNFADGTFKVEVFEKVSEDTAALADSFVIDRPGGFFAIGEKGCFDNHIHCITCLSPTGHSLHVYSDDARRGVVYREQK